jgi:hypothetical protein
MTCPQCGLPTLSDQKFCRSCGAGLQLTTQPIAERATALEPQRASGDLVKDQYLRSRLVLWAFVMMFVGVAIGLVGKMILHEEIVTVVGVLVSLAGMLLVAYSSISPARLKQQSSIPSSPRELKQSQSTKQLPQGTDVEYVASVTERTTNLLQVPVAARPKQKEDREPEA